MEPYAGRIEYLDMARQSGQLPTYANSFLHTGHSAFAPRDADFKSRFSTNVTLNIPIVAAAMDTVTELKMAIRLAQLGGLGVIHRNMDDVMQAKMIARCKHSRNGFIPDPVCIPADWTVEQFLAWRKLKEYTFNRFLVTEGGDAKSELLGMFTGKDLQFCRDHSRAISEVMTKAMNLKTGENGMTKEKAYRMMYEFRLESIPVRQSDGSHGLFLFDDLQRIFERKDPMANVDHNDRLRVAAAIATGPQEIRRAELAIRENVDVIVIDVAHVDSRYAEETVREVAALARGKTDVVPGNFSHPRSAVAIAKWGVDGLKVGQGPSSICITRTQTGTGAPQAWAVAACAQALHEADLGHIPLCADGGIVQPGNVPVAIGLGAHSVMVGTLFAGTDEAPGEIVYDPKLGQAKKHRGMGSRAAMKGAGGASRYAQDHLEEEERLPEGVESLVPYRGPLRISVARLREGLRKGMYNAGCPTIEDLRKFSLPYIGSSEAVREADAHDVVVTNAG